MATVLQFRRGSASEAAAFTGAEGELFIDMTNRKMYVHDGITQGGFALDTDTTLDGVSIQNAIDAKQDILVSGTDIKTINGVSLLGSGDFIIPTSQVTSVNGQTGDVVITSDVTSVNGLTGDVSLTELPKNAAQWNAALYDNPLDITGTVSFDPVTQTIYGTFSGSIHALAESEDALAHVFGHSIYNGTSYPIFAGTRPPLCTAWNIPNTELDREFATFELNFTSEVDNGDGTFTYAIDNVTASIPVSTTPEVDGYARVNQAQIIELFNGNDAYDEIDGVTVIVPFSPELLAYTTALFTDNALYSKDTTFLHMLAASTCSFLATSA